ncbi:MAG: glycosyltransferase family 2 protein [Longimicrobiales bacterium]
MRVGTLMDSLQLSFLATIAVGFFMMGYAYFGYPLFLLVLGRFRGPRSPEEPAPKEWPLVSVSVPAYNEEHQIEDLIRSLLALDYPRDRLQILVVSDASSDGTDDIVRRFSDQGVELLSLPERGGKTKAENAAAGHLRGEIIVNTDASIRIAPSALKPLITALSDPTVGLASGRDISVGPDHESGSAGESGYVGYEMKIRDLETRLSGIVGASGCFYAIRAHLHRIPLPESLSRDFAAALHAREHGYRAVSVTDAICYVPRSPSLRKEYRRKVRTITRGMETLFYKRSLLNPFTFGLFSWMLFSHKACRWALPWFALATFLALVGLAFSSVIAKALVLVGLATLVLAMVGWLLDGAPHPPRVVTVPAFVVFGNLAAMYAFIRFLRGDQNPIWEPTRRTAGAGLRGRS